MHLWTEYEGSTLAGYLLGRLHRSEGRSAFFLTSDAQAHSAMLRLTESHFDDGELIGRWQKTSVVMHPNLQAIMNFGGITFDTVSLAFCLLEPTDGSLSDVIQERVLSIDEAREVIEAVAGAVDALHGAGLIHGHVNATNVFAVGEIIKLRSDCVRECAGDFEADTEEARDALRQRDIRDLGLLLLRCLGLDDHVTAPKPPRQFDRIIPRMLDGSFTAKDILNALRPAPSFAKGQPVHDPTATARGNARKVSSNATPTNATGTAQNACDVAVGLSSVEPSPIDTFSTDPGSLRSEPVLEVRKKSAGLDNTQFSGRLIRGPVIRKAWVASACAVVVLALIIWHASGAGKHTPSEALTASVNSKIRKPQTKTPQITSATPLSQQAAAVGREKTHGPLIASSVQASWHVIAYTYNHEQEASTKAEQLRRRYVSLQPQVFSPTGRAPYFVALGGSSDAAKAMALRNHARQVGLPRDTYARNF